MAIKKYTTFKIIGLLALAISAPLWFYYLERPSSTTNPLSHNHILASQNGSKSSNKSSRSNSISSQDNDSIFSFFDDKSISDFLREPYAIIAIIGGIIFIIYLQSENNIFQNMLTWPGSPSSTGSGDEADTENTNKSTLIADASLDVNVNSSNNDTNPSLLSSTRDNNATTNATHTEKSTIGALNSPKPSGASGGTVTQIRTPDTNYGNNIANTFGYGYNAEDIAQLGQQPISPNIDNSNKQQQTGQYSNQPDVFAPLNNFPTSNKYAFIENVPNNNHQPQNNENRLNIQLNNNSQFDYQQEKTDTNDDGQDITIDNNHQSQDPDQITVELFSYDNKEEEKQIVKEQLSDQQQLDNEQTPNINLDNDNNFDNDPSQLFDDDNKEKEEEIVTKSFNKQQQEDIVSDTSYDTAYDPDYQVTDTDIESTYLGTENGYDIANDLLSEDEKDLLQNPNLSKQEKKKLKKKIKKEKKQKEKAFSKTLDILSSMLQGKKHKKKITARDKERLQQLYASVSPAKKDKKTQNLSPKVVQKWNTFRKKQNKVKFNIEHMYAHYQGFISLFLSSDPKCKNLLQLDTLLSAFPNITEIKCKNIDCIAEGPNALNYLQDIVSSRFITALKDRLVQTTKNKANKLVKIIITTSDEGAIKDDCDLYVQQFATLGWQIQLENKHQQITLTKASTKKSREDIWPSIINQGVIPQISFLIGGAPSDKSNLTTTAAFSILQALLSPNADRELPYAVQAWEKFLENQKSLRFNIKQIYTHDQKFIRLFFSSDPKEKHVLSVNKIAQLFPHARKIICEQVDYVGKHVEYSPDQHGCSPLIVGPNYLKSIYTKLQSMNSKDWHPLQEITITTAQHTISDECHVELHIDNLNALGWFIVEDGKQIILTKTPAKYVDSFLPKIESMIKGEALNKKSQFADRDILILRQLLSLHLNLDKNINKALANEQKKWAEFSTKQTRLKIDMQHMYRDYQHFITFACQKSKDIAHKWLFSVLVKAFPNTREIKCKNIDCIGWKKEEDKGIYSRDIVNESLIADLGSNLKYSLDSKWDKLTKITITTSKYEIDDNLNLQVIQFTPMLWSIKKDTYAKAEKAKKNNRLILSKEEKKKAQDRIWAGIINEGLIPKISYIIGLKPSDESNLTAGTVEAILQELIFGIKHIPPSAQKIWKKFTDKQKNITINIKAIYKHNPLLMPLLIAVNPQFKNVLLLDKIAILFPNATEITCEAIDYVGKHDQTYKHNHGFSASLVSSNFMLGLKNILSKTTKHTKLKKIVLETRKNKVSEDCNLYVEDLSALNWKIQLEDKSSQIILTKAEKKESQKAIWKGIIQQGVIPKITTIIDPDKPDESNLTVASTLSIFRKLLALNAAELLPHALKQWNKFTKKRKKLKFDMEHMHLNHKKFMPLLFSSDPANLFYLDTIVRTFPNVKAIECKNIDCGLVDKNGKKAYAPDILNANFMLNLKNRLSKMESRLQPKLEKIILTTVVAERDKDGELYVDEFDKLAWHLKENNNKKKTGIQITLTRKNGKSRKKKASQFQQNDDADQVYHESDEDTIYSTEYDTGTETDNPDEFDLTNYNANNHEQGTDIEEESVLYLSNDQQHIDNNSNISSSANLDKDQKNDVYIVMQEEHKHNDKDSIPSEKPILIQKYKKPSEKLSGIDELDTDDQETDNDTLSQSDMDQLTSLSPKFQTVENKHDNDKGKSISPEMDRLTSASSAFEIIDEEHDTSTQHSSSPLYIVNNKDKSNSLEENRSSKSNSKVAKNNDKKKKKTKKGKKIKWFSSFKNKDNRSSEERKFEDALAGVTCMIQGKKPKKKKLVTDISNLLSSTFKGFPSDAPQQWDEFKKRQKALKFNIKYMQQYYSIDQKPLLCSFDPKHNNRLRLNDILEIFPNVIEITCENVDYVGTNQKVVDSKKEYAASSVFLPYRDYLVRCLRKIDKQSKLEKVTIKTQKHDINNDDPVYTDKFESYDKQFQDAGWYIMKESKTLIKEKNKTLLLINADNYLKNNLIPKISSMTKGQRSAYNATAFDTFVFDKLITRDQHMPSNAQKRWDKFKNKQKSLTINMSWMYRDYNALFDSLLFPTNDKKAKNLLSFDSIFTIFPNVIQITCQETDCNKWIRETDAAAYESSIVHKSFIAQLKTMLENIKNNKNSKLEKIIIQTNNKIKINTQDSYYKQTLEKFYKLHWKIQIGIYFNKNEYKACKNCQLTLTKIPMSSDDDIKDNQ